MGYVHQRLRDGMEDVLDRVGNAEVLGLVQDVNLFGVQIEQPARTANERPRLRKNCTILLLIDEIQTVPGEPDDESAHILQHLESGSDGQAILPVLAGLPNSLNVLRKLGLSRHGDASVTYMKPLSRADVAAVTWQFIQHFGAAGLPAAQRRRERTFYGWSKGWPKHLQNGLAVLGDTLLAAAGQLDTVDVMAAQRQVGVKRIDYY